MMEANKKVVLNVKKVERSCKFSLPKSAENKERIQLLQDMKNAGVNWTDASAKVISNFFQFTHTQLNNALKKNEELKTQLELNKKQVPSKQTPNTFQDELNHWHTLSKNLEEMQTQVNSWYKTSKSLQECRKELYDANMAIIDLKIKQNNCKCVSQNASTSNVKQILGDFTEAIENFTKTNKNFRDVYKGEIRKLVKLLAPNCVPVHARGNVGESVDELNGSFSDTDDVLTNDVDMGYQVQKPPIARQNDSTSKKQLLWYWWRYCDAPCTEDGNYPIHEAVITENLPMVENQCKLLKYKRKRARDPLDLVNNNDQTAFHLAIIYKVKPEITKMLFDNGSNIALCDVDGNNIVHLAIMHEYLEELVKLDIVKNNPTLLNRINYDGYSPLHLAVLNSKYRECDILIRLKADLDIMDGKSGRTALFHAVEDNNYEICKLLCDNDAERSIPNFAGDTIAHLISERLLNLDSSIMKIFYYEVNQINKETKNNHKTDNNSSKGGTPKKRTVCSVQSGPPKKHKGGGNINNGNGIP